MSELRSFVERIENLDQQIADLNSDKRDLYAEAKSDSWDVGALKAVIAHRKKPDEATERRELVDEYLAQLGRLDKSPEQEHARAPARARAAKPKPLPASVKPPDSGEPALVATSPPTPPASAGSSNTRPIKETAAGITADSGEPASVSRSVTNAVAGAGSHNSDDDMDIRNMSFRRGPKAVA